SFCLYHSLYLRDLHSFPTRRSSDLGKGHAKRDVAEWMIPVLWPWKVVSLPMRGPRPTLKGEESLELRLMDDISVPATVANGPMRSEEHTSELQSRGHLVCRLVLEKK